MSNLKKMIPAPLKLLYRLGQRSYNDRMSGNNKLFAKDLSGPQNLIPVLSIEQPVKTTAASVNKIHNLSLAINRLNNIIIQPGQIFSFWHLVSNPSQKNGYQKSRSIINGEIEAAVGGGLCQLSGLIYFLALRMGMQIKERHAHSIDIYREEERFTPLGSDATVSYGYKDLRFFNQTSSPVSLSFQLSETALRGTIAANETTAPVIIKFEHRPSGRYVEVDTICKSEDKTVILHTDRYHKLTAGV